MTLFEKHIGRECTKEDMIYEREWYLSRVSSKKHMDERWIRIGFSLPKPKQLNLFNFES